MGTLGGFPNPPALWLRRAKPGYAYAADGTLGGFPNPPALWLRRAKPGYAYAADGTLGGFPNPPAFWLRRAKPGYAYAVMGTLGGLALHSAPPTRPATPSLRSASPNPPAFWRRRDGSRPQAARGRAGWVRSLAPTKSVGKARLRLRGNGNPSPAARPLRSPLLATQGLGLRSSQLLVTLGGDQVVDGFPAGDEGGAPLVPQDLRHAALRNVVRAHGRAVRPGVVEHEQVARVRAG